MAGTFGDRLSELAERVGDGLLRGQVVVDQAYAQNQHESSWFKHPEGGKAYFLRDPLFSQMQGDYQDLADAVLNEDDNKTLADVMADNMERLSAAVYEQAPLDFGDLKASGHPMVMDGEETVYDRKPNVHRLSPEELKIKGEVKRLFEGDDE